MNSSITSMSYSIFQHNMFNVWILTIMCKQQLDGRKWHDGSDWEAGNRIMSFNVYINIISYTNYNLLLVTIKCPYKIHWWIESTVVENICVEAEWILGAPEPSRGLKAILSCCRGQLHTQLSGSSCILNKPGQAAYLTNQVIQRRRTGLAEPATCTSCLNRLLVGSSLEMSLQQSCPELNQADLLVTRSRNSSRSAVTRSGTLCRRRQWLD